MSIVVREDHQLQLYICIHCHLCTLLSHFNTDDSDEDADWLPEKSKKRLSARSTNQKKGDKSAPSNEKAEETENSEMTSQGKKVEIPVRGFISDTAEKKVSAILYGLDIV